jgi:hypothetical protein
MHVLHRQVAATLDRMLRERRIVVFYDPREEFGSFLDEFDVVGTGVGDLPRILVNDTLAHLARFGGSFFGLKAAVEPILRLDRPDPLLVYLPGFSQEKLGRVRGTRANEPVWNVLFELDCAGQSYKPSLRDLARNELRRSYTDGDIDAMLAPASLTWHDVVRFLEQDGGGQPSLVKLVLGKGASEELLVKWLSSESTDGELAAKGAVAELYRLVHARLGLELGEDAPLPKARHLTLRHALINEFRADLEGQKVPSLHLIGAVDGDELGRVRDIASRLRAQHAEDYVRIADGIEGELGLASLDIQADALGAIDTFRFEEVALLARAAQLVCDGHHTRALALVGGRKQSFWVDRDLHRLAQWETCRLAAEVGREVARVRPLVKKAGGTPSGWVEAYAADWYQVDRAQRALEAWVAKLDDDPEPALEQAVGLVRRHHEALLQEMADGWAKALVGGGWSVGGVLHQTRIYPEHVEPVRGRVAYFFVDAMRYEMAADLVEQLDGAEDLRLAPAIGALPSITPIGMAALLPGASASFSVVEHKDKLAARIGSSVMPDLGARMKYLRAVRPDARDIDLGELLQKSTRALETKLESAALIVVRSQSIDGLGEIDGGLLARQIMDTVVGNLARAVRKLAKIGVEHFVVTADHGHQFSVRKDEDMLMDKPGGQTVDQHRRCWAGHGGQTPAAATRVTGANLGYDTDLDFIFPTGVAVFRAGGDLAFHHGGISLQEMVVPVVTLRIPKRAAAEASGDAKLLIEGYPKALTNRTFGLRLTLPSGLFAAPVTARVLLLADGQEVGRAGMAPDAEFDRTTSTVVVPPGKGVSLGMMLTRDETTRFRVVALDPATDAVLAQTNDIDVKLGM